MVPSSSSSQPYNQDKISYILQVIKAKLDISPSLRVETEVYTKITFPKHAFQTHNVKSVDAEWNRKFNVVSFPTSSLKIEVKNKKFWRLNPPIGEALIRINELLCKCMNKSECELDLRDSKNGKTGSIWVRLDLKSPSPPTITETRRSITSLCTELQVMSENLDGSRTVRAMETIEDIPEQTSVLPALESLHSRMGKLRPENLQPLFGVMDEVAKIHPYVEAAWKVVSSLYKIYQKKIQMDEGIMDLVEKMNGILSFVEDVDVLTTKLRNFTNTIQIILQTIEQCGESIYDYLSADDTVRSWKVFSEATKLSNYAETFKTLTDDLSRHVVVHAAVEVSEMHKEMKEIKEIISRSLDQPPKQIQVIIPPPPTEIFAGRKEYLEDMERFFDKMSVEPKKQQRFVLYGMGGMGKMQLMLKFLERNGEKFTILFMIDASSEESIFNSLISICMELGIPDTDPSKVLTWLSRMKEEWLLFYDNADNPNLHLSSFFPQGAHGNIIMTTRNAELRTLAPKSHIEVLTLDEETAVFFFHLLLQSSQLDETDENVCLAQILVNEFGCLALAVVQAGSYISIQNLPLRKYLEIYKKSQSALLQTELGQGVDYKSPVFSTWEISYAGLTDEAKALLNICAFLYRDGITEDLIRLAVTSATTSQVLRDQQAEGSPHQALLELIHWLHDETREWKDLHFMESIRNLCSYSFVQQSFPGVYTIHPLVHDWTRQRLEQQTSEHVQQSTQLLLYFAIPPPHSDKKLIVSTSRMLLPHLGACGRPKDLKVVEAFSRVYPGYGRYKEAEILQTCVVEQRTHELGKEHLDSLNSSSTLASIYHDQCRFDEAEKIHVEILEARKRVLGPDHGDTLTSMHSLALIYWEQGRWNEAEKLNTEVLEARKWVLGPEHPDTVSSTVSNSAIYWNQGRWAEVEKLDIEVLEARKRVLGHDHPDTLASMDNLAQTYLKQRRWTEAEKLATEVVEAKKQMLGHDHPSTLGSMSHLASAYRKRRQLSKAEKLYVEVLEARKQVLGIGHLDVFQSMEDLSATYANQNRWNEAEKLTIEVVEARRQLLGCDHPATIRSMTNLAAVYRAQKCFHEAINLQRLVVEASTRAFGPQQHLTLSASDTLDKIYHSWEWRNKRTWYQDW